MNLFVTGATGFIGAHLCRRLQSEDHSVHVLLRHEDQMPIMRALGYHPLLFKGDCKSLTCYMEAEKLDGIVHLASLFLPAHKPEDIDNLIASNILLGTKLLEAASTAGIRWFLNTGTFWQHYNNEQYNPVNLYAATKEALEVVARYYTETSNIIFTTIKLNDTFGPGDTRLKIFNLWQKAIQQTGEKLPMSPGEQVMDISYIDDVIEGYLCLIRSLSMNKEKKLNNKSFALYSNTRMTLKELASLFEKSTGKKIPIQWGARPYRLREVMEPQSRVPKIAGHNNKSGIAAGIKSMPFICKNESTNQKIKH